MGTPRTKKNVSLEQLEAFYSEQQKQAARGLAVIASARESGLKELTVANYASGVDAIDKLALFTSSVSQAVDGQLLKIALGALDGSADERIKELTEKEDAAKQRAAAASSKRKKT